LNELCRKHPVTFGLFFTSLIPYPTHELPNLSTKRLLNNLVPQSDPLTPAIFIKGSLGYNGDVHRVNFCRFGRREAIEEALEGDE
jgi:hypothetical protein